nr:RNA-dependent RNA polymerase [Solemoviridae sp.]
MSWQVIRDGDPNDLFRSEFWRALTDLNMDSTLGSCILTRFGNTIGEFLEWNGESYSRERVETLQRVVYDRYLSLLTEPVCDDIKVFVKQEPHKVSKIQEGRFRLISAVSLIDTMVDRVLFGELYRNIARDFGSTTIMIGWNPIKNGVTFLRDRLGPGPYLSLDKTAWDWTVQEWMVNLVKDYLLIVHPDSPNWFRRMVKERFRLLFGNPFFIFSDGTRIQQKAPGIMKSGCYLTILFNSLGQILLHHMAAVRIGRTPVPVFALGDDTIQRKVEWWEDLIKSVESFGFSVKHSVHDEVIFCGFVMDGIHFVPEYREKHRFQLEHLTLDEEVAKQTLQSYQILYYHDLGVLKEIRRLARERGLSAIIPRARLFEMIFGS